MIDVLEDAGIRQQVSGNGYQTTDDPRLDFVMIAIRCGITFAESASVAYRRG